MKGTKLRNTGFGNEAAEMPNAGRKYAENLNFGNEMLLSVSFCNRDQCISML
jgi:hypothetical protein